MKKGISIVLLCFSCIGIFTCSMLPVQAIKDPVNSGECQHVMYIESFKPELTGFCIYDEGGHEIEYGMERTCIDCRTRYYVDTYFIHESHQWEKMWSAHIGNELIFDCMVSDCPVQLKLAYSIE